MFIAHKYYPPEESDKFGTIMYKLLHAGESVQRDHHAGDSKNDKVVL